MAKAGRPRRTPTAQQILDAFNYAKTGADEDWIVDAVGIPEATFRHNKLKPEWADFRAEIRRGRGVGNVLVLGKNYQAATSDTDPTRAKARELHLKASGALKQRVEVSGDGGGPVLTGIAPSVQQYLKALAKAR